MEKMLQAFGPVEIVRHAGQENVQIEGTFRNIYSIAPNRGMQTLLGPSLEVKRETRKGPGNYYEEDWVRHCRGPWALEATQWSDKEGRLNPPRAVALHVWGDPDIQRVETSAEEAFAKYFGVKAKDGRYFYKC